MTKNITTGVTAIMIAVMFTTFSPHTASAGGSGKVHIKRVITPNVIGMNRVGKATKGGKKSQPTAPSRGYTKAGVKRPNVVRMNRVGKATKGGKKSQPTAPSRGYTKARIKRPSVIPKCTIHTIVLCGKFSR